MPTNELLRPHKAACLGRLSGSNNEGEVRVSMPQHHATASQAGSCNTTTTTTNNSGQLQKLRTLGEPNGGIREEVVASSSEAGFVAGPVPVDENERVLALQMALKVMYNNVHFRL